MRKRLWLSGLLAACLSSFLHAKGDRQYLKVYDFSKGVDTYHSSLALPDGYVQNALNVSFDSVAPISKRSGYTVNWSTKSYQFTGLWTYTDSTNTTWQLARSSDQITANNLTGSASVLVATVSVNNTVGEASAFGNAYFVDQTQGVYYWNGTSTTYVSGSPKGSIIGQFHNRLWVTGAAVPNGNQLYGSKYYDGTTWTTGINATDPVQYSVGLNDNFDNLTALYVYLDTFYLFKHYTIFALTGFDQTNFQISQLTQECGCIDTNSIQTYNGGLKFVSLRGIEDFDGYHCTRISSPIKNKVDPAIQQSGFSQNSWVQQSQADWQAGTISNEPNASLSTLVSPPTLVLSTGTFTDSTNANFTAGTQSNTQVIGNAVLISTNNSGSITNPSFDASFSGNWTISNNVSQGSGWARVANGFASGTCGSINDQDGGGNYLNAQTNPPGSSSFQLRALDQNNNVLQSADISFSQCSWTLNTVTPTTPGQRVKFQFYLSWGSNNTTATTSDSYIWGGPISFYANAADGAIVGNRAIDNVQNGSSTITTGSFTSQTFDTGISSPVVSVSISSTSNTEPITFVFRSSSFSSGGFTDVSTSQNASFTTTRYLQYITTFTVGPTDNALSKLNSATFNWTASSGVFTSACHSVSPINSWGNLNANSVLNGGTLSYSVCSSPNSNCSSATCKPTTANSQITIATNTFVQVISTFTTTISTQSPILNNFVVQWYTGNKAAPMSSSVWDNRYWLALTTNTVDLNNDAVVVLNSKGAWTVFSIQAGAFTQTKGGLYHADATATGNIYQDQQGTSDNGNPINAFIQTKDYSMGELSSDDYLYAMYPSADNSGNCNMTVQYMPDRSGTNYSLGTVNLNEFSNLAGVRLPYPVDSAHQDFGQTMNYTIGTNDNACTWNFYGFESIYRSRPIQ